MTRLAIFASGSGTNAENIIRYFQNKPWISITCVCTNRPDAYVIERVKKYEIPVLVFSREGFYQTGEVLDYLKQKGTDWIILAGFLWLIPTDLIESYPSKIINIHPALLPKFGGKGMYGPRVHEAVINSRETHSGITIHYVNPEYDKGSIIFQSSCPVNPDETPESLADRVHELEYLHYPRIIEQEVLKRTGDESGTCNS
jgi:phosphoribosylglycinamide formyltransferase 1